MTTYLITEAQRDQFPELIDSLLYGTQKDVLVAKNAIIAMLQSLPVVDSEVLATVTDVPPAFGYSTYIRWHNSPPPRTGTRLYTSPQALTPITADDVTDEMVKSYINEAKSIDIATANINKSIMAAAYNAVIKNRSEA